MNGSDDLLTSGAMDEKLYGLVEIAERQQAMAQLILDQVAGERSSLHVDREAIADVMGEMRADMARIIADGISASMASVVASASRAMDGLGGPVEDRMARAASSAEQADRALRSVVGWATTRLLLWGLGALAGLVLLGWLASGIVLWWDTKAIASAHVSKQQLQMEVAELIANRDAWVEAGMANRLQHCGPKKKPCVAVDEAAGSFGEQGDFRLVKRN